MKFCLVMRAGRKRLQVATCSPMGALVYGCGGIVIDGNWLRVLDSGCERIKHGIYGFNLGKSFSEEEHMPSYLLVANDILGKILR